MRVPKSCEGMVTDWGWRRGDDGDDGGGTILLSKATGIAPSREEVASAKKQEKDLDDDQRSTTSSKHSSRSSRSLRSSTSSQQQQQQTQSQPKFTNKPDPNMAAQIQQIKRQQSVFQNDLKLMRQEMSNMVHHVTTQMNKLERMVTSVVHSAEMKANGNVVPTTFNRSHTITEQWSRPRRHIEAAKDEFMPPVPHQPHHHRNNYQQGGAELVLQTCLSNGSDDGEIIRQCNAVGASSLDRLSIPTRKRLYCRLIDMMDHNSFVLQALPWFQTAYNLHILPQVLASPGTYARAVRVFQKYAKTGRTSLSTDCMRLYQVLAN